MITDYQLSAGARWMPPSRRRSLLRDLADGLLQQMFLWGCDVRRKEGNLLLEFGMQRIVRDASMQSEGTSRYRMPWEGGTVELHGFCAGWYPRNMRAAGVLFIRYKGRLDLCAGGEPVTPGKYDAGRIGGGGMDDLLEGAMPLVRWLVSYEGWVREAAPPKYRRACWMEYLELKGARGWLPPDDALRWLRRFAESPASVPRARTWHKDRIPFLLKNPRPHFYEQITKH